MTSSTLQLHFLSGSLLWQIVIVISFARDRKLHQLTMHLDWELNGSKTYWYGTQPADGNEFFRDY